MGNGKPKEANRLFGNVLRFLFFTYLIAETIGRIFLPQLLGLLGAAAALTVSSVVHIVLNYVLIRLPTPR